MRAKEIDIIRTIVILFLVLFHAFSPFTGGWAAIWPEHYWWEDIYKWIGKFCYAGMLETFVAISGYVFFLAESRRITSQPLGRLVKSKLRRLIVPALVWGVAYWLLFVGGSVGTGVWRIANGIGHLWFLPMLFWCFLLEKTVVMRFSVRLWVLGLIAVLPYPALPFCFNNALYYLFFFHLGGLLYRVRDRFIAHSSVSNAFYLLSLAVPLLIMDVVLHDSVDLPSMPFVQKRVMIFMFTSIRFIYASAIVLVYFIVGIRLREGRHYAVFHFIAGCSFGIYLLQEFIIRILYYKTDFLHDYAPVLPLYGFVAGFLFSLLIVALARKTEWGRRIF